MKHETTVQGLFDINKLEKLGTKNVLADWIFRLLEKLRSTSKLLEKYDKDIKSLDEKVGFPNYMPTTHYMPTALYSDT